MIFEQVPTGGDRNFSYIVGSEITKQVAVIDPSYDLKKLISKLKKQSLKVAYIINTHSHPDHVAGNRELKEQTQASVILHKSSEFPHDISVNDNDSLDLDGIDIKMLHTPGHIPDHICILINNEKILTGDLLFVGKIGGTGPFFPGSDPQTEFDSLHRIMQLDEKIEVFPGHDYGIAVSSTIGNEKRTNPFLQKDKYNDFIYLKDNWQEYKKQHGIYEELPRVSKDCGGRQNDF